MTRMQPALNLTHIAPARQDTRQERATPASHLGDILVDLHQLNPAQVVQVLEQQRRGGQRFGEAAIALGYIKREAVVLALSRQFGYPCLGDVAASTSPELVTLHKPFGGAAEHFRSLRAELSMALRAAEPRPAALAVLSPAAGEGRSYCAANVAVALAQTGSPTLLIDADLRRPRQHQIFRHDTSPGLSGLLAGHLDGDAVAPVTGVPGLSLLVAGAAPPNPLELLERPSFELLLHHLAKRFAHIVVDTPAAGGSADAAVIAARCGAALLVARRHASQMAAFQNLQAMLARGPARVLGLVLNER